jgi:cytochrome c
MRRALRIASLVAALCGAAAGASAEGNAARGEALFRPCAACHMIGEGAIHRIGPHLNGLLGRGIGAAEGYDFSEAMVETGGDVGAWSESALDTFLANPRAFVPGTAMVFRGVPSAEDREDLIAFIVEEGGTVSEPAGAAAHSGPSPEIAAILEIEGDEAYGQYLSSECTSCHIGEGGEDIPSIRGMRESIFVAGLAAYRSGEREHQVMNTITARLGDEEIAALAAYFATADN